MLMTVLLPILMTVLLPLLQINVIKQTNTKFALMTFKLVSIICREDKLQQQVFFPNGQGYYLNFKRSFENGSNRDPWTKNSKHVTAYSGPFQRSIVNRHELILAFVNIFIFLLKKLLKTPKFFNFSLHCPDPNRGNSNKIQFCLCQSFVQGRNSSER